MAKLMAAYLFAKIVQIAQKANLFTMLWCRLSYAKIVQTEYKANLFVLLRCRLSYAKIIIFN